MADIRMTIACFWWGTWCSPYGAAYVGRLYNMFARHLSIPHDFVCFTDRQDEHIPGVEFRQLPKDIMRWSVNLPKFWVYSEESGLSGRVVLVDLDSVIKGSMDDMLSYDGPWCGIKPMRPGRTHIGGGLVSFVHEEYRWLWHLVNDKHSMFGRRYNGRERKVYKDYIKSKDRWQDLYPGQLVGYKRSVRTRTKQTPAKGVRFVAFHGNPRPHEIPYTGWLAEHWR